MAVGFSISNLYFYINLPIINLKASTMRGVLVCLSNIPPLKKQTNKQINNKLLNAPLSQSQYTEQQLSLTNIRAFSKREPFHRWSKSAIKWRLTVLPRWGVRSVGAAVFMVVLSAHIKLHKPF